MARTIPGRCQPAGWACAKNDGRGRYGSPAGSLFSTFSGGWWLCEGGGDELCVFVSSCLRRGWVGGSASICAICGLPWGGRVVLKPQASEPKAWLGGWELKTKNSKFKTDMGGRTDLASSIGWAVTQNSKFKTHMGGWVAGHVVFRKSRHNPAVMVYFPLV